ncbi:glutamate 5-kinase [Sutcliffiella rhizosphaerae]|uniref:Glutamate 5-kinase n=1 Tax=Sutcliffiella rhizosphaerae TaxID=2880967 RepID=A0ABM8YQ05_9BACI|nr:glutamate 5-kinase [Sutcliffiella rhizosphaerae]CAG9621863.1 Glutamate 5-kinase 1 [Sutcliffiella rhizosphaerae]
MTYNKEIKRLVIKIGSSSLTSTHGEISRKKLERLVDDVAKLKDIGYEVLLVSSGAVAAGYRKLGCLNRPTSLPEKQAAASIGQGLLMEAYSELFLSNGYVASQILITREDFSDENRYNNARNTANVLLERGIVPIFNENDTVTVNRLKFGDNDTLSAKVAGLIDADLLIILSDIDGLYDGDPRINKDATLLRKVEEITPEIDAAAGESASSVGTGGMKSKIDAVKIAMASGIPAFLGRAGTPNILLKAIKKQATGTYFQLKSNSVNLNHKKQWIAFNSGPEGEVVLSETADVSMLGEKQLLPSDISQVIGEFKEGSVVKILDYERKRIGLGVVNYSSKQLKAYDTTEDKWEEEVVKNDNLVCHLESSLPVGV